MRKPSLDKIIEANKNKTGHIPNKGNISLSTNGWLNQYKMGGGMFPEYHSYAPPRLQGGGISFLPQQDPEMMYRDRFNTSLSEEEQKKFNEWVAQESERRGRNILMDKGAYDVQGFWKSGDYKRMVKGHGTDTWKKPNHPTFSNQSKYHGIDGFYGGNWKPDGGYQPSKQSADMYGPGYYNRMFAEEPGRPEHLDASRYMSGANAPSPLYYKNGGGILSRTVTCSNCSHSWKGVDGGMDPMTCHKCGGMIKMQDGGPGDDVVANDAKAKEFLRNWYTGRAELPQFKDVATARLKTLNDLNYKFASGADTKAHDEIAYYPLTGGKTAYLTDPNDPNFNANGLGILPEVIAHEYQHALDYNNPQQDRGFFRPVPAKVAGLEPSIRNWMMGMQRVKNIDEKGKPLSWWRSVSGYDPGNPDRVRTQNNPEAAGVITMFRMSEGIDPKQVWDEKNIMPYINKYSDKKYINDHTKENYTPYLIQTWMKQFGNNPKVIADMLNKYVKNDGAQTLDMARHGGLYKAQDGLNIPGVTDFKMPRVANSSNAIVYNTAQGPVSTATTGQNKQAVAASTADMGKGKKAERDAEAARVAERKAAKAIQDGKAKTFTFPTGETKSINDMNFRERQYVAGKSLEARGRLNENKEAWYDMLNPASWIADMAGALGTAPYEAKQSGSNMPYVSAIVNPLLAGRMMGSGSINPISKKFWTNEVSNPEFLNNINPTGILNDYTLGLLKGGIEQSKGFLGELGLLKGTTKRRPFFETFPITKSQKAKVIALQDEAFADAKKFTNDYWYGDNSTVRPILEEKIREILPDIKLAKNSNNLEKSESPFNYVRDRLIPNTASKKGKEGLDEYTIRYLNANRGRIGGVNDDELSLTLRNNGLYYKTPRDIANIVTHESGHTGQKFGYYGVPPVVDPKDVYSFSKVNWGDQLAKYNDEYSYFISNPDTELGRRFQKALVSPKNKIINNDQLSRQTWRSSPLELHSELMASKYNMYKQGLRQGFSHEEMMRRVTNPGEKELNWLLNNKSIKKHFKKETPLQEKLNILKILPATIPAVAGAAALQQKKEGGMITDPRGQWAHPGKNTRIPGGNITMQGVPYPVLGKANNGMTMMMYPGQQYSFPGASHVDEYPMMQQGGWLSKYNEGGTGPCPPGFIKNAAGQCILAGLDVSNKASSDATRVVNPGMNDQGVLAKDLGNTHNFNRGWMQSPMYNQMITASIEANPNDKDIPGVRERLSDPSRIQVVQKDLNAPTTGGETEQLPYTPSGPISKVTLNTNTTIPRQEVINHEILGHATDLNGALIPITDIEKMNKYFTPQEKLDTSGTDPIKLYANARGISYTDAKKEINVNLNDPAWAKEWNKHVSEVNKLVSQADETNKTMSDEDKYINSPTETRARMMSVRKLAKDNGVYDPFTQKMTRENLRKLKSLNNFELDSLFNNYTEDELLDMFNSISMNEQPNNPTMAKYGGWLSKYQYAGTVIPGVTDFKMPRAVSDNTNSIIYRPNGAKTLGSNPNPVVGPVRGQEGTGETIINTTGKILDPTGISSWGDAGVAIGEAMDDPSLINVLGAGMETLGALPFVHYLGAAAKLPKTVNALSKAEKTTKLKKVLKGVGTTAKWVSGEPIIAKLDKVTGAANLMGDANKFLVGVNRSNRFINNIVKPAVIKYYSTQAEKSQALQSTPDKYLTFKRPDGSTFTVDANDTNKVNEIRDAIISMNADSTFNVETEFLPTWAAPAKKKNGGEAWLNKYL